MEKKKKKKKKKTGDGEENRETAEGMEKTGSEKTSGNQRQTGRGGGEREEKGTSGMGEGVRVR